MSNKDNDKELFEKNSTEEDLELDDKLFEAHQDKEVIFCEPQLYGAGNISEIDTNKELFDKNKTEKDLEDDDKLFGV